MKKTCLALTFLLALASTIATAQTSAAQKNFDTMKSLAGAWEGKTSDGRPVQVSYTLTANGSALMSDIETEHMITMFHLDGNRLLMTHYCAAGNQPRMKASSSADGKTIAFDFLDATNLASAKAGHMQRAVFTVVDPNHHTEEWTFIADGKEKKETFDMQRKN